MRKPLGTYSFLELQGIPHGAVRHLTYETVISLAELKELANRFPSGETFDDLRTSYNDLLYRFN